MNRSNNHFFNNARWADRENQDLRKSRKPEIGGVIILAVAAIAGLVLSYRTVEWALN
jgi:UDP-N-acetylmuramyl pentapeptide phosphotransferase/UDP-N-acetylglucosamine-1-phosphate transferase